MQLLRAATGLFAVSPSINPGQFQKFVDRLELADQYPGVQGIGFLVREKRGASTQPQHRLQDFQVWPEENQDNYAAALYFEPLDRSGPVASFTVHTDPVCKAAMETARDTGLPAT